MKHLSYTLRVLALGVVVGMALNEGLRRRQQKKESDAFWNSPFMLEQRREHEELMRKDPIYRMRAQEWEDEDAAR
jgi:hypothetical protein